MLSAPEFMRENEDFFFSPRTVMQYFCFVPHAWFTFTCLVVVLLLPLRESVLVRSNSPQNASAGIVFITVKLIHYVSYYIPFLKNK